MRRRGWAAALLLTLLATGCSTASSEETGAREPRPPTTTAATTAASMAPVVPVAAVLGDSNVDLARTEIEAALAHAGFRSDIHGVSGSGLKDIGTDWLPVAQTVAAQRPNVIVLGLGTNDAVTDRNTAAFAARLDVMLDALGASPIVLVTHTEAGGTSPPANERAVNDAVRAAAATRPNVTVLDLAPRLAKQADLLSSDGLHYSVPDGRVWFAEQLASAARANAAP